MINNVVGCNFIKPGFEFIPGIEGVQRFISFYEYFLGEFKSQIIVLESMADIIDDWILIFSNGHLKDLSSPFMVFFTSTLSSLMEDC